MPRIDRIRSRLADPRKPAVLVAVTPAQAGWRLVRFSVRQLPEGSTWRGATEGEELAIVLLEGDADVSLSTGETWHLGPRAGVFSAYPHAYYVPRGRQYAVTARVRTVVADCRAPSRADHPPRGIAPADCGFEIRGGGNATRQIVDIMPPAFPADRLMVCEVYTPSGNWSSYPPHKHDREDPPNEAALEEVYFYRFHDQDAYGIQRLYAPHDRRDRALTVRDGDLVLVRNGYHPFVSAHGYDAYYLNVLAGSRRSMAASDDPRYARLRTTWPPPDPRVPLVAPPSR